MTIEIHAQGTKPEYYDKRFVADGGSLRIGRSTVSGWKIWWDQRVSSEHFDIDVNGDAIKLTCVEDAKNPICHKGKASYSITIAPGDCVIVGRTAFHFATESKSDSTNSAPKFKSGFHSHVLSGDNLAGEAPKIVETQVQLLSSLPELIAESTSDENLAESICGMLLKALPKAEAVAALLCNFEALAEDTFEFAQSSVVRLETRPDYEAAFKPSRRLIHEALCEEKSVVHIWEEEMVSTEYTQMPDLKWAFASPIQDSADDRWCLYVSGKGSPLGAISEDDLIGDLRFTELVSQFLGSVRQVRSLQDHKARLNAFFSPKVVDSLARADSDTQLAPTQRDISVLFCDIRGFSLKSEQGQDDLFALFSSASAALDVMAKAIIDYDGAIADFQGDAALGFWGWPLPNEAAPLAACRAAIEIVKNFAAARANQGSLLNDYSVGVGLTYGSALAGKLGAGRQAKIGVFGPVVNLGARLESMTKQVGTPICIDEATAEFVAPHIRPDECVIRCLGPFRPKGMTAVTTVFGLTPVVADTATISHAMVQVHREAVELCLAGKWRESISAAQQLLPDDGPAQFLLAFMKRYGDNPPPNWDGVFSLPTK